MDPALLLAKLRALVERMPNFEYDAFLANSNEHLVWVAQAHALVSRWSRAEGAGLNSSTSFLGTMAGHEGSVRDIIGCVQRAIADLELDVPADIQVGFGAGDVYDFFRALRQVVASAEKSIFIVDPYINPDIFDQYVSVVREGLSVRLMSKKGADRLAPAKERFNAQHGTAVEVRHNHELHDRVVFVDGVECYVVGQSLNVAAKDKATYLVPLSPDAVSDKLDYYNRLWENGREI